jgi:hypothetical protein
MPPAITPDERRRVVLHVHSPVRARFLRIGVLYLAMRFVILINGYSP